jgi:hypothetical protein
MTIAPTRRAGTTQTLLPAGRLPDKAPESSRCTRPLLHHPLHGRERLTGRGKAFPSRRWQQSKIPQRLPHKSPRRERARQLQMWTITDQGPQECQLDKQVNHLSPSQHSQSITIALPSQLVLDLTLPPLLRPYPANQVPDALPRSIADRSHRMEMLTIPTLQIGVLHSLGTLTPLIRDSSSLP